MGEDMKFIGENNTCGVFGLTISFLYNRNFFFLILELSTYQALYHECKGGLALLTIFGLGTEYCQNEAQTIGCCTPSREDLVSNL